MTSRATAFAGDLIPLLERKRLLDGAWVISLIACLVCVAALWFVSVLEIDLATVSWFVFVYLMIYVAGAGFTDRLCDPRLLRWAMRVTMALSVLFLGLFWHLVGGLRNPMFLVAFAIPVIVSALMTLGLQAHFTAALSIIVATTVAAVESPGLRWYLERLRISIPEFLLVFGGDPTRSAVFPGVVLDPGYEFTLIATFSFMQLILAFVSTPLTSLLLRINGRFETSQKLLGEAQGLFHAILRAGPEPGVIVYADSWQVVQASDSFFHRMMLRPSQLGGKGLFEVVTFQDPEQVRAALDAPKGEIPFCVYRVGQELRIANISFYRTEHAGVAYRYLGWHEVTDVYYLQATFNAVQEPLLVVADTGRLNYANDAAQELFGTLYFGMDCNEMPALATLLLENRGAAFGRASLTRREINGSPYTVNSLLATLPGGGEACTILWLHCVAREEALFDQAVKDSLTGIYNRRYLDEILAGYVERSHRGQRIVLGYFDLDDFKSINDTLGHAAGDAALRAFVAAVKSQLRETDVFARRGGDEFAVLFVDCDLSVAMAAVDRLREALDNARLHHEGRPFAVRFSTGLAMSQPEDDVDRLVARADRALYDVKEAGKAGCGVAR